MTRFVSFAQNQEDVVLWRALRGVGVGFYVDVGAADPTLDSVTRAFYDRGWSGINIEPTEKYHGRLVAERPRDINLRALAGARPGMGTLFVVSETGLSTVDPRFAERQIEKGRAVAPELIAMVPLSDALQAHGDKPIHFLKIDVEGAERDVLEGMDFTKNRPWIVIVEATEPETSVRTQHIWEDILVEQSYDFALFDGLNCFYVAQEHSDLKEQVAIAPNYSDGFRRFSEQTLSEQLAQVSGERDQLARHVVALEANRAELEANREAASTSVARLEGELIGAQATERRLRVELADARASQNAMAEKLTHVRADAVRARRDVAARDVLVSELHFETIALSTNLTASVAECVHLREYQARVFELERWVDAILASNSWRVTAPIRRVTLLLRRLRGGRHKLTEQQLSSLPALPQLSAQPTTVPDPAAGTRCVPLLPDLPERTRLILERLAALDEKDTLDK